MQKCQYIDKIKGGGRICVFDCKIFCSGKDIEGILPDYFFLPWNLCLLPFHSRIMKNIKSLILGSLAVSTSLLAVVLNADHSQAAIVVNVTEVGSDVVWSFEGTFDVTGMSLGSTGDSSSSPNGFTAATAGTGIFGVGSLPATMQSYTPGSNPPPANYGTGGGVLADSSTGDPFAIASDAENTLIFLSQGYSGEFISGTSTYLNETFATLGLTEGTYVSTYPSDTVTLNIVASESETVPEPSAILGLLAVGSLGALTGKGKKAK